MHLSLEMYLMLLTQMHSVFEMHPLFGMYQILEMHLSLEMYLILSTQIHSVFEMYQILEADLLSKFLSFTILYAVVPFDTKYTHRGYTEIKISLF